MPRSATSRRKIARGVTLGWVLGAAFLVIALGAAAMLALDHFAVMKPPGCGPQSGCEQVTRGPWGTIPLVNWPVSLFGVMYFGAMLAAWIASLRSGHWPRALLTIALVGGIGSIVLSAVMLRESAFCKYCLASHIANLGFIAILLLSGIYSRAAGAKPLIWFIAVFTGLGAVLWLANARTESQRQARDEGERQQSMQQIIAAASQPDSTRSATTEPEIESSQPFTGRWRLGPMDAPIRIVMFFDYQCRDCQIMEGEAMSLVESRSDVSLSVKHFPMNTLCNPDAPNLHSNACWAARAAEAAGMLRGNEGFWQMHRWMFAQSPPGSFTDASFPASLQQLGYDAQQFISTMSSQETRDRIKADIAEAKSLGLFYTPMVFINGVELRGVINNPGSLLRSVQELAATNPPRATAARDRPDAAARKYIEDWAQQPLMSVAGRTLSRSLGPADAPVQIDVWGDYTLSMTADLDRAIKSLMSSDSSIRYTFRHYPVDQTCNPNVARTMQPEGCRAARIAEAAATLGGDEAYWKMHDWLLAHQSNLTDDAVRQAAAHAGLDPEGLLRTMNDAAVAAAIREDVQRAVPYIKRGVPTVFINGRWLPRWKLEDADILRNVIERAASMQSQ